MARKRKDDIIESVEELAELESKYRGKPEEARVKVLRLLKDDPDLGIDEAAVIIGYSKQAVKRWLKVYRDEGLLQLLTGGGRRRVPSQDLQLGLLQQKLAAGDFQEIGDVMHWISQRIVPAGQIRHDRSDGSQHAQGSSTNGHSAVMPAVSIVPDNVLRFLSSLVGVSDVQSWTSSFREALRILLGDVDLVSIGINVECDLQNPSAYRPNMALSQSIVSGTEAIDSLHHLNRADENRDEEHIKRFLDNLRRRKFKFAEYHPPVSFVYHYGDNAYLGGIVLWRERSWPPVSSRTVATMESLRSFVVFLLSDFVARHQLARPMGHSFAETVDEIAMTAGLTLQERRILMLQLLGMGYEEIADNLNISLNTVRTHVRSIYEKTGARGQTDLVAKYFTLKIEST
ncbi:MAG TPA: helix-turn-helix transcriptional regulator [Candidatus Kapabacteria bacterium]|nr:helix-turn-helix transcriptional regulator [Candidatus Kapabacteria bacterium]